MAFPEMHKLVDGLIDKLFSSDNARLAGWIDNLVKKNQQAKSIPGNTFLYDGKQYRLSTLVGLVKENPTLHPSVLPAMSEYVTDEKIVDDEKSFVRQAIVRVLEPCETLQDIRDALPDCLVACIDGLMQLPRTRPEAFTIANDARATRQFMKMLPDIQSYAATRLI